MHKIRVGRKIISDESPCFIIAEVGSNHNGSLRQAKQLIDIARDAGADAVKFQIFRAKTMYPDKHIKVRYLKNMGINDSLYSIIERNEVPYEWIDELYRYAKKSGIEFMATPFDVKAVKVINPYVNVFKIASYESMFSELIEEVKKTGKPLFISTGGSTEEEIDMMITKILLGYEEKTVLMHCIAKYPAPIKETFLSVIPYFRARYNINVGYSDHTADPIIAPTVSVALGARVIEKHITLSKKLPGPDHIYALEPDEFRCMVTAIRQAESALHIFRKRRIFDCEKELYFYKRCLYAKKDLSKGQIVNADDLIALRNIGIHCDFIHPVEIDSVIGKTLKRNRRNGAIITRGDI